VATSETKYRIIKLRGSDEGVSWLMSAFYSDIKVKEFNRYTVLKNLDQGPLKLFAGGSLDGRKGVAMALHSLAQAKMKGVKFSYRLGGKGPESRYLQQLAIHLGLRDEILFGDALSGEDYLKELGATHIYLLPSLRESAGLTMMEAMLAGCVPIVADCGGPAAIVTDECGYKLLPLNRKKFIDDLAKIIIAIDQDRNIIKSKGIAAVKRIATSFTEENYRSVVNSMYRSVIKTN
jgi:glycosyltransferase involved in cell wall biosynthesis